MRHSRCHAVSCPLLSAVEGHPVEEEEEVQRARDSLTPRLSYKLAAYIRVSRSEERVKWQNKSAMFAVRPFFLLLLLFLECKVTRREKCNLNADVSGSSPPPPSEFLLREARKKSAGLGQFPCLTAPSDGYEACPLPRHWASLVLQHQCNEAMTILW